MVDLQRHRSRTHAAQITARLLRPTEHVFDLVPARAWVIRGGPQHERCLALRRGAHLADDPHPVPGAQRVAQPREHGRDGVRRGDACLEQVVAVDGMVVQRRQRRPGDRAAIVIRKLTPKVHGQTSTQSPGFASGPTCAATTSAFVTRTCTSCHPNGSATASATARNASRPTRQRVARHHRAERVQRARRQRQRQQVIPRGRGHPQGFEETQEQRER